MMRLFITLFLSGLFSTASAAQLPGLQPLPPPPPLDANAHDANLLPLPLQSSSLPVDDRAQDATLGQEITIIKSTEQSVEEYRVGGKLYMIKITPKIGPPYYLVDDRGDGSFSHYQNLGPGFNPPRWVIHRF
ncbi:conserved exported hypothetical protein [Candidatus Nitrotoga sp. BS]|uniref:DUF2782 domain-containing protein n=1 Tax=Candidatus Nitrotoga sp. BS TaxID=2890408 RepID=UPI001EF35BFC|nr:DUF2782 domain-containing protein [Candidatus Nitrotoga sp. BS]CAH1204854.1 conserved exported hypothetical protein [Candidatus Nitrotoga sp. BS]